MSWCLYQVRPGNPVDGARTRSVSIRMRFSFGLNCRCLQRLLVCRFVCVGRGLQLAQFRMKVGELKLLLFEIGEIASNGGDDLFKLERQHRRIRHAKKRGRHDLCQRAGRG